MRPFWGFWGLFFFPVHIQIGIQVSTVWQAWFCLATGRLGFCSVFFSFWDPGLRSSPCLADDNAQETEEERDWKTWNFKLLINCGKYLIFSYSVSLEHTLWIFFMPNIWLQFCLFFCYALSQLRDSNSCSYVVPPTELFREFGQTRTHQRFYITCLYGYKDCEAWDESSL